MNHQLIIKEDPLDYEPSEQGLGHELYFCLNYNRNRIAQIVAETGEKDTFGDLLKKSIRTALKLKSLGVLQEDIICLCSNNNINTAVPYIASQLLGNAVASLDPSQSKTEYVHLLKKVQPKIIFVSKAAVDKILEAIQEVNLKIIVVLFGKGYLKENVLDFEDFLTPHSKSDEDGFRPVKIKSNKDTAIICFSSGTTGLPKGICLSHYGLMAQIVNLIHRHSLPDEVHLSNYTKKSLESKEEIFTMLNYASFYWISTIWVFLRSIFTGQARILCESFDADQWWKIIDQYNVAYFFASPIQAADILSSERSKDTPINSLKSFNVGGGTVTESLMNEAFKIFPNHVKIVQGYGQSENGGILTCFPTTEEYINMQKRKPLSCGLVMPGTLYKVVDLEIGKPLGPNEKGELRYKSNFTMTGYYNQDSSEAFDEDGWVKSGDVVYYDEEFCFYVVDRIKEMFKYKSWHIVPASLENILLSHPEVKRAMVIGIPHGIEGDHPMGLVVLNEGASVSALELEKFVEERVLERQRLRAGVKLVKEVPCTVTGKMNRRAAKEMVLNNLL